MPNRVSNQATPPRMTNSLRTLLAAAWALFLLVLPASAHPFGQERVTGALFARSAEGGAVEVALRLEIAPDFHIYHTELGPPDAVGKPTSVKLTGLESVGAVTFPTPFRHVTPGAAADGSDSWINAHEGTIVVRANGKLAAGAGLEQLAAKVSGLVCDEASCQPFALEAVFAGRGDDALFAAPAAAANAQAVGVSESGQVRARLFVRATNDVVDAAVEIEIEPGFHIYHDQLQGTEADGAPTDVILGGAGIAWEKPVFPPASVYTVEGVKPDGSAADTLVHEGVLVVRAKGKLERPEALAQASLRIEGQVCDDAGCLPFALATTAAGRGSDALFAAAVPGASSNAGSALQGSTTNQGLGAFLLAAVFGALFALVMPCTYPMIPITISFFSKQAGTDPAKRVRLAAAYGLGIILVFILIGVVVGPVITRFANHPWTNVIIGTFFVVFALSLFGLFELRPPQFLMGAAGQARSTGGYAGVFLMGATLVITSFTCTAPFVGSLLSYGASQPSLARVVMGMGVFGLTMAIPFVGLALVPGKLQAMPKSGDWMHTFKVFMGFVELAAAFKFISNADLSWQWQVLNRELFLILWTGIFMVAGLFLLGFIKLEGESHEGIGPMRLVCGTAVASFALYCGWGALGNQMDSTMTAIVPPYSAGIVVGHAGGAKGETRAKGHEIVVDNYAAALGTARSAGKYLLINFTGYN